ncbi:PREDICTED: CD9 antigen-like [Branchiostoma belcheri]|uniref:Tetraspanin n=1 Tax=Branchiostoma belcheri TaxID=7741 RepID=A0A6P5A539_BRABE|nr:PREDICTED: CD9 antigen-like [Branchiostoma belcheri]
MGCCKSCADCSFKCMKIALFVFNLIFLLLGLTLVGVGIWVMVESNASNAFTLTDTDSMTLYAGAIVLIVGGVITVIVSVLGAVGAWKEHQIILGVFFTCLLILLCLEVAIGVYYVVQKDQFYVTVGDAIDTLSTTNYSDFDPAIQTLLDTIQKNLQCCGLNSTKNFNPKPSSCSCDVDTDDNCCELDAMSWWDRPCKRPIILWMQEQSGIIAGVGIGFGLVMVFGMTMSCCLCQKKRKTGNNAI